MARAAKKTRRKKSVKRKGAKRKSAAKRKSGKRKTVVRRRPAKKSPKKKSPKKSPKRKSRKSRAPQVKAPPAGMPGEPWPVLFAAAFAIVALLFATWMFGDAGVAHAGPNLAESWEPLARMLPQAEMQAAVPAG